MKIFYFICLGLFGCSEFVSVFYEIEPVEVRNTDEMLISISLLNDGIDMKRLELNQDEISQVLITPVMDMVVRGNQGGTTSRLDMIEIDQNLFTMTDDIPEMERVCLNPEENDPKCPSLSCDMYQNYQIKSVGQNQICFLQKYTAKASNCVSFGICHHTQETFCEPSEAIPTSISIDLTQTCIQIEGCQDQTPGSYQYAVDQPCQDGKGICNLQGECKFSFSCDENTFPNYASNGKNEFCLLDPNAMNVCEFYINKEGFHLDDSELSCLDFCAKYQTQCIASWDNQANTKCSKADPIACNLGGTDRICRCGPL